MSTMVDNRVVEMRFDNDQFERNVRQSIESLDNLKDSLRLDESVKSIDAVEEKFSVLERVVTGVLYNIGSKLSGMGLNLVKQMTIEPLSNAFASYENEMKNVRTMMIATGDSMGYVEDQLARMKWYADETSYSYDTLMRSASSFVSSGIDLETAVQQLQGIGNFAGYAGLSATQATHAFDGFIRAISQGYFNRQNWSWIHTAGMDTEQVKNAFIDAAVKAGTLTRGIDGIARTAKGAEVTIATFETTLAEKWLNAKVIKAVTGEMGAYSQVLYEFQNALEDLSGEAVEAADAMAIMDNSFEEGDYSAELVSKRVEAYQIAVKKAEGRTLSFADAEKELATRMQTASEIGFKAGQEYRTFADTVEATSTAVVSRWASIFKALFGNAEEAKTLWTQVGGSLYDLFVGDLDGIVETLDMWKDLGGFQHTLQIIGDSLDNLLNIVGAVREALSNVFPPITAKQLYNITNGLSVFVDAMMLSEEAVEGLRVGLEVVITPLKVVGTVAKNIGIILLVLIFTVKNLINSFFELVNSAGSLGNALSKMFNNLNTVSVGEDIIGGLIQGIKNGIDNVISTIASVATAIISTISDLLGIASPSKVMAQIGEYIIQGLVNGITFALRAVKVAAKTIATGILNILRTVKNPVQSIVREAFSIAESLIARYISTIVKVIVTAAGTISNGINRLRGPVNSAVKSVMSIIGDTIRVGVSSITSVIKSQIPVVFGTVTDVLNGAIDSIDEVVTHLDEKIPSVFQLIRTVAKQAADTLNYFFETLNGGKVIVSGFAIAFAASMTNIALSIGHVIRAFGDIEEGIAKVFRGVGKMLSGIGSYFRQLGTSKVIEALGYSLGQTAIFIGVLAASLLLLSQVPTDKLKDVAKILGILAGGIIALKGALDIISSVTDTSTPLENVFKSLSDIVYDATLFLKIAALGVLALEIGKSITLIAVAIKIISTIPKESLLSSVGVIAGIAAVLAGITYLITKAQFIEEDTVKAFGSMLKNVAKAFVLMAIPIKLLSSLTPAELDRGNDYINRISVLFAGIVLLVTKSKDLNTKDLYLFADSMIKLAVAMDLMMVPFIILNGVSQTAFGDGLIAIITCGLFFGIFMEMAEHVKPNSLVEFSIAMKKMAIAVDLMAIPFLILQNVTDAGMENGFSVMVMAGVFFGIFMKLASMMQPNAIASFGFAMVQLAIAVDLMTIPMLLLKDITPDQLNSGIVVVGMAGVLFASMLALAHLFESSAGAFLAMGASLILASVAVDLLAGAIAMVAMIPNEDQALKSAIGLGAIMVAMSLAIGTLASIGPAVLIAAGAITIMCGSMYILAAALDKLSKVDAGGLARVNVALKTIDAKQGLKLAGVLAAIGLASVVLGAGLVVIAAGLLPIGIAAALIGSLVESIEHLLTTIVALSTISDESLAQLDKVIERLPALGTAVGQAIVSVANALLEGSESIIGIIKVIVVGILNAITSSQIKIAETISTIINVICRTISANAPIIAEAVVNVLRVVITFLREEIPLFVNFLSELGTTIAQRLVYAIGLVPYFGMMAIGAFILGLSEGAVALADAAAQAVIEFCDGITDAVYTYHDRIQEAADELKGAFIYALTGSYTARDLYMAGVKANDEIARGLDDSAHKTFFGTGIEAAEHYGQGFEDGMSSGGGGGRHFTVGAEYGAIAIEKGAAASADVAEKGGEILGSATLQGFDKTVGYNSPWTEMIKRMFFGTEAIKEGGEAGAGTAFDVGSLLGGNVLDGFSSMIQFLPDPVKDAIGTVQTMFGGAEAAEKDETDAQENETEAKKNAKNSLDDLTASTGKATKATKKQEKSIDELAKEYNFGEKIVSRFIETYGNGLEEMDSTINVANVARGAIDGLALTLYQASEQYQQDLKDSDMTTEKYLSHIKESFDGFVDRIGESFKGISLWSLYEEPEEEDELGNMDEITSNWDHIARAYEEYGANLEKVASKGLPMDLMNSLIELGTEGSAKLSAFANASDEELNRAVTAWERIQSISEHYKESVTTSLAYSLAGFDTSAEDGGSQIAAKFGESYANGLDVYAGSDATAKMAENSLLAMREALGMSTGSSEARKVVEISRAVTDSFVNGINEGIDQKSEDIKQKGNDVSKLLAKGMQDGIREHMDDVNRQLGIGIEDMILMTENKLQIHSPSRLFHWYGAMIDEGLALGLKDDRESPINSMRKVIDKINESVTGNIKDGVVIKPALDLSEIRKKAAGISSMFDDQRLTLQYAGAYGPYATLNGASLEGDYELIQNGSGSGSGSGISDGGVKDIVAAITDLRGDVNSLNGAMRNMQVRMDSGALVGSIVGSMDQALGREQIMRNRGV